MFRSQYVTHNNHFTVNEIPTALLRVTHKRLHLAKLNKWIFKGGGGCCNSRELACSRGDTLMQAALRGCCTSVAAEGTAEVRGQVAPASR